MNLILSVVVLIAIFSGTLAGDKSIKWGYGDKDGPSKWPKMAEPFCTGGRQSPINIEIGNVRREHWKPFVFQNYDAKPTGMRMKNNGHSAQVEMDGHNAPTVSEGGLPSDYVFHHFHFHWGADDTLGSEHTVDGVRYPMEMHLVHYKKSYVNLGEAVKHVDGLAVLGVLFEVSQSDNPAFAPIIKTLKNIQIAGQVSQVDALYPLSAFLPSDRERFFRYEGSLTTPSCNEVVEWTVFKKTVPISERQLAEFRNLKDDRNRQLVNNFRPPQQLRHRTVYERASDSSADSSTMKKLGLAMYFMSTMAVLMMNM